MRYLLAFGNLFPLLQRPVGATIAAWKHLPLAECFEIQAELAEALGAIAVA